MKPSASLRPSTRVSTGAADARSLVGHRIHVFGASGSGTTTLGKSVASALGSRFLDTDTFYWYPTDPPFTQKREPAERVAMIERAVAGVDDWVLSGSLCGWGDPLIDRFTLVVFLQLSPDVRLARLAAREGQRYGDRIEPGGDLHEAHEAFLAWARLYDTSGPSVRSLALHEGWLPRLACPVLRLDAARPVAELRDVVLARVNVTVDG
jgi:adenylate kinase family enzyme